MKFPIFLKKCQKWQQTTNQWIMACSIWTHPASRLTPTTISESIRGPPKYQLRPDVSQNPSEQEPCLYALQMQQGKGQACPIQHGPRMDPANNFYTQKKREFLLFLQTWSDAWLFYKWLILLYMICLITFDNVQLPDKSDWILWMFMVRIARTTIHGLIGTSMNHHPIETTGSFWTSRRKNLP